MDSKPVRSLAKLVAFGPIPEKGKANKSCPFAVIFIVEGKAETATALTFKLIFSPETALGNGMLNDCWFSTEKSSPNHFLPTAKKLTISFS